MNTLPCITVHHYIDPDFQSQRTRWLTDEEVGFLEDHDVSACVDVCITRNNRQEMLVGLRTENPAIGLAWIMGGGMRPGETIPQTAQRNTARETGLQIEDLSRFIFVSVGNYTWSLRQKAPQKNGCHKIGLNVTIDIAPEEVAQIDPRPDFSALHWVSVQAVAEGCIHKTHRAMHDMATQLVLARPS